MNLRSTTSSKVGWHLSELHVSAETSPHDRQGSRFGWQPFRWLTADGTVPNPAGSLMLKYYHE